MDDKRAKWGKTKAHQSDANEKVGIPEDSEDAYRSGPQQGREEENKDKKGQ
ncbi:hypothetical protein [Actinomadura sp. WMMA1423]|uniref:hypothetical protein n=1 Tax=Actinomadura sp. WMMA1423 TaxID=2591108 RepID=UPI00143D4C65|nr:hypothetical protein [Actinomadura sp. WMMA1423]